MKRLDLGLRVVRWIVILGAWAFHLQARDLDEFKVKRQEVFEFAHKPRLTREGDRVTVTFEVKGFCDATVAIENAEGRIIRHLASGVLGPKAPEPFQKETLKQAVVWDGKDDQGRYLDDKDSLSVRVSLGLKPVFERTLFWSPKKRISPGNRPQFASAPEGVYVLESGGVDHLRLFDHAGNYVRTVYPFPPDYASDEAKAGGPKYLQAALPKVQGLKWLEFPQDGKWLPQWSGIVQATLFTSGSNVGDQGLSKYGGAASAMAWHNGRLALAMRYLNRLATDGTTGGLPLEGPKTMIEVSPPAPPLLPTSAAFSPDGKWLYLTGHVPGVTRMEYSGEKPPELFLGGLKDSDHGKGEQQFCCPKAVACDSQGRVYVADYGNDRIQVFTADGKFQKSVPVNKPLRIYVHPKTGHLYVASWLVLTKHLGDIRIPPVLTHLGAVDDPKTLATYPLPFSGYSDAVFMNRTSETHDLFVDFHAEPPVIWLVPGSADSSEKLMQLRRSYSPSQWGMSGWAACHYRLLVEKDGKLEERANFAKEVSQAVTRVDPPSSPSKDRQRMYVHPRTGILYLAESDGSGVGAAFRELALIDPGTGKVQLKKLPFTTEDMDFDLDGHLYLRTDTLVARFEPESMREVPWDYGEEWEVPGFDGDGGRLVAVVPLPGTGRPGCFHLGGFGVSPKGNMVVSCYNERKLSVNVPGGFDRKFNEGRPYQPPIYPGRLRWGEVHVWDKHGKPLHQDVVSGLPMTDGLAMDRNDNIYALLAANRVLDGKEYPLERAETLMKFKPKAGKILSTNKGMPVPLPPEAAPKRPVDIDKGFAGKSWVEGVEWMYGGVGFGGFNSAKGGGGCSCWNARFALDLFARSFATELNRFNVAVLDTNGNLILRIGKYGNVDDGVPLVKEGGPANPRSVGGDEVALLHPSYVATHSDRRLFIADYGNYRILSVKLEYHASERLGLKDVPNQAPATAK